MHVCYFDESGDTRSLEADSVDRTLSPVFALGGLAVNSRELRSMNAQLVALKDEITDRPLKHEHDQQKILLPEIKGQRMRQFATDRGTQWVAFHVYDRVFEILEQHDARLHGRVFIKDPGTPSKGEDLYNRAVQLTCTRFNDRLEALDHYGVVVGDNRHPGANKAVAHAVYLQKFHGAGDQLPRIAELPSFGQSDNHVGLQLADLVCELLVSFARTRFTDANAGHKALTDRYDARFDALQQRFVDRPGTANDLDGVFVGDISGKPKSPATLFGRN